MDRPVFTLNYNRFHRRAGIGTLFSALLGSSLFLPLAIGQDVAGVSVPQPSEKRVIGPTTIIAEAESELDFKARVDTGATTSSVHVEEWAIEDESPIMEENIGKKIRFRIMNHRGESEWLESRIAEIGSVKTSEQREDRYKVELTLCWQDVKKPILVTLNDRSHMKYPMLLGRNFLAGEFVVDVELHKRTEHVAAKAKTPENSGDLPPK